jgi:SecD/SecF fusion protein
MIGGRSRNFFVLLLVLGLVAASAVVIKSKKTQLGLDLRGGVELIYQGRPTPQQPEVTGAAIDQSIDIIRQRIDAFGVAEPEISRLGSDEISVGLPDVKNQQRAADQVGTTAQMYFYDWEPNLLGPAKQIASHPGTSPPAAPLSALQAAWKAAGRDPNDALNQNLIVNGAEPSAYEAALIASKQPAQPDCKACTEDNRFYLFSRNKAHDLVAGPETNKKDLFVSPTGQKRPKNGIVVEVPKGTLVVSEQPSDSQGNTVTADKADPGWYAIKDDPALAGTELRNPEQNYDPNQQPNVSFDLTDKGGTQFHDVTRAIAQRAQANYLQSSGLSTAQASGHFAVVLDNEVISRPIIDFGENPDGISGNSAEISGLSLTEAQDVAQLLRIGALPINLKLISQSRVSATLGEQALHEGLKAGIVGLILVVFFLLVFYRFLGLIASVALGAYGVIFFALIKLIPITLTLPGIAGLILTIGVAADSNIVIFERIKEEVRAGRSMPSAIAAGYRRGIATIIDANVVTLLTAFILFVLATAGVKGFAFTLGVGTVVSLLTAVVFTQALLSSMSHSRFLRSPAALGAGTQRARWHFDFMGASRWFFTVSGLILTVGAISLATKQLNLGIDFESGTQIAVSLQKPTDEEGVRSTLDAAGVRDAEVQQVTDPTFGSNTFQIKSRTLQPGQVEKARSALQTSYGVTADSFENQSVGPTFGKTVANNAAKAIFFSILLICGYVAIRFSPKFAIPVLIALFHDILITGGVYSLTGREVTSGTVAAFLTILGYSLYDTIIVFDRIRENLPRMPRAAFSQIVNRSMSEVLTRSLATSFSTLIGVACLLIFGGATLKDFAFAMMVGIASGTYSSIFIASPVLTAWKEQEPELRARRERIAAASGAVPAFVEELPVAKLDGGEEGEEIVDGDGAAPQEQPAAVSEPQLTGASRSEGRRSQADILREAGLGARPQPQEPEGDGDGDGAGTDESSPEGDADAASKPKQESKRRRQRRRKHGRRR